MCDAVCCPLDLKAHFVQNQVSCLESNWRFSCSCATGTPVLYHARYRNVWSCYESKMKFTRPLFPFLRRKYRLVSVYGGIKHKTLLGRFPGPLLGETSQMVNTSQGSVCVFFCLLVDIQHNQCPSRFFYPLEKYRLCNHETTPQRNHCKHIVTGMQQAE